MKILVLGSGQLARMMSLAGAPLDLNVTAYDVGTKNIVHPLTGEIYDQSNIKANLGIQIQKRA